MTLFGKLLHLSEPQLRRLWNGEKNSTFFRGLFREWKETFCRKCAWQEQIIYITWEQHHNCTGNQPPARKARVQAVIMSLPVKQNQVLLDIQKSYSWIKFSTLVFEKWGGTFARVGERTEANILRCRHPQKVGIPGYTPKGVLLNSLKKRKNNSIKYYLMKFQSGALVYKEPKLQ